MGQARAVNPRGQGDRLRQEILDAAGALLARPAPRDGVTLRAIARQARVAAPSIYLHFADRQAIFDEVLGSAFTDFAAHMDAALAGPDGPTELVHRLCRAYVDYAQRYPDRYWLLFRRELEQEGPSPSYPEGLRAFGLLVDAVAAAVAVGASRSTSPYEDSAALLVALHGLVTLVPATPGFPWPTTSGLLDRLVDGLARLGPCDPSTMTV